MWDFPGPGVEPVSLASAGGFHWHSGAKACGIFLDQGWSPCPQHRQVDFQPVDHQGSLGHGSGYEHITPLRAREPMGPLWPQTVHFSEAPPWPLLSPRAPTPTPSIPVCSRGLLSEFLL